MTKKQVLLKARKKPSQKRSKQSVESILTAAARILVNDGWERFNTNRVAAIAGVSVGSLYQYFPNKDSIISALIDRHMQSPLEKLREKFEKLEYGSLEVILRELIKTMIEIHSIDPKLHLALLKEVPSVSSYQSMHSCHKEIEEFLVAILEKSKSEINVKNLKLAVFMVVHSVESLTHSLVFEHKGDFEIPEIESEIYKLISFYLKGNSD